VKFETVPEPQKLDLVRHRCSLCSRDLIMSKASFDTAICVCGTPYWHSVTIDAKNIVQKHLQGGE
jgi:hypothetical protein